MLKFINKYPQDFILSNGKSYTIKQMLSFAFGYFKLNYKNFVISDKKLFRKKDFNIKKSNNLESLRKNRITRVSKIYGKNIVYLIIKYYLNEKKH